MYAPPQELNKASTHDVHATRAIYFGLGCADDPDVDDYYNKARAFPIIYNPDEDPEVIEEMKIAESELNGGSDDKDIEGEDQESSSEGSTGDEGGGDTDDGWVDEGEDEEGGSADQSGKQKRKRKVLSCVDKVRNGILDSDKPFTFDVL
jgi:hypothetical protein